MKIVPLGDKVVVKRLDAAESTAGGIILPDSAREQPQQGRVVCVGLGRLAQDGTRQTLQVSEGDRVIFSAYAGMTVQVQDDEFLVMSEADILAVLEAGR